MAKRLVKVAKELNVGTSTIVDHLLKSGFEIENKPTAKITEAMEAELLKEFQKSIAIKEKADQLVIGTRPTQKKEPFFRREDSITTAAPPPPPVIPPPPKKIEIAPTPIPKPVAKTEVPPPTPPPTIPIEEKTKESPTPIVKIKKPQVQLNVVGKIDLDKKIISEPKVTTPDIKQPKIVQEKPEPISEPKQEEPKPISKPETTVDIPVIKEEPKAKIEPSPIDTPQVENKEVPPPPIEKLEEVTPIPIVKEEPTPAKESTSPVVVVEEKTPKPKPPATESATTAPSDILPVEEKTPSPEKSDTELPEKEATPPLPPSLPNDKKRPSRDRDRDRDRDKNRNRNKHKDPKRTPLEKQKTAPIAEPAPSDKATESGNKNESNEKGVPETPKKQELIRAETPELRGLKILGKINIEKRGKSGRKKKKDKPATSASGTAKTDPRKTRPDATKEGTKDKSKEASTEGERKRRPRKRRRVTTTTSNSNSNTKSTTSSSSSSSPDSRGNRSTGSSPSGGNSRRTSSNRGTASGGRGRSRGRDRNTSREPQSKEVSQKEIEDKIKATMARMSGRGKKKRQRLQRDKRDRFREKQELLEAEQENEKLQLTEFVTVQELANLMDIPVANVIMTCMSAGEIVSINQRLDAKIIELVAMELGHEVEFISVEEQAEEDDDFADDPENLSARSPIVTVMGHVDHGKTSLLDYIRNANVASGEAGGITQHIGAYEVRVGEDNSRITFLDTPGHEAFTAMRARGAKVTDIAIIIIAADDSIMPQTKEAISHAQAADVPMVFAINKIDKAGANPEKIKQELASMNLLVEDWGGEYQSQDISAKSGEGIEELLEKVLLVAELLELQANPDRKAVGTVLEASLDKGRGYVTKTLVQTGTLSIGDSIVAGEYSGKVKAMFNERGKRVKKVGPSTPVLILGLNGAPQAGERFKETDNESEARQIAGRRAQIAREQTNRATKRISLAEIGRRLALGTFKELNLIVKGDVDGSIEALSDSLIKLSQETVQVNVIHKAVGQIIESDVLLASASDAIIIGFQVRPSLNARKLAEREGVQIKTYSIIYETIDEIKTAIEGMLEPTKEERNVCNVEIREVYKISKIGTVAGCYVLDGKINRNTKVRLIRNGIVVYPTREGASAELASLKRFKEDVKEVKNGMECGLTIKNFNDIKVGDVVEGFEIVEIKQTLK